jgi:hypothetical protein
MTSVELEWGAVTTRQRILAWTKSAARDVGYAGAVLVWSVAGFSILVSGVAMTASLLVVVGEVFIWIGFTSVVRWTTWADRTLAARQRHERVPAVYRRSAASGCIAFVKTLSSDPRTWRDLAWLALTSCASFAGEVFVVTAAGLALSYMSMPSWYWAVTDAHTEYGLTQLGKLTVETTGEALTMTAIGLVLIPLVLLLASWFATAHSGLAIRLLGPWPDQAQTESGSSHA